MKDLAGKDLIKDKDDVLSLVGEALSALGREDGIFSYGVVGDKASDTQLIYFDLPRVSPLQFNIKLTRGLSRAAMVGIVKEVIERRLESATTSSGEITEKFSF